MLIGKWKEGGSWMRGSDAIGGREPPPSFR